MGDLFQQYAAKYIGIGRGIPLSNTNQLWGLAWGALVFGELASLSGSARALIVAGSLVMILGALGISTAVARTAERNSRHEAMGREAERYGLNLSDLDAAQAGDDPLAERVTARRWWDGLIVAGAVAIFVWLAWGAERPAIIMDLGWAVALLVPTLGILVVCGWMLWKRTRFS